MLPNLTNWKRNSYTRGAPHKGNCEFSHEHIRVPTSHSRINIRSLLCGNLKPAAQKFAVRSEGAVSVWPRQSPPSRFIASRTQQRLGGEERRGGLPSPHSLGATQPDRLLSLSPCAMVLCFSPRCTARPHLKPALLSSYPNPPPPPVRRLLTRSNFDQNDCSLMPISTSIIIIIILPKCS